MGIEQDRLLNCISFFGIPLYHIHAPGHAGAHDLKQMIKEINPESITFVHTERADLFTRYIPDLNIKNIIPEEGKDII